MSCDCGLAVTLMIQTSKFFEAVAQLSLFQPKDRRYVDYNDDKYQEQLNRSKQASATKAQSDVDDAHGMQALQRNSLLSLQDPCNELANLNQIYATKFGLLSHEDFPSSSHYKRQHQPEVYVN